MGWGDHGGADRVVDELVSRRVRLHVAVRVATRAYSVVFAEGAARRRLWPIVAALAAVADLGVGAWLAADDRVHLVPRLMADAADAALWSSVAVDTPDAAASVMVGGMPLAMEAGVRYGLAGLAVPVVTTAVAAAVRRRRGQTARVDAGVWPAMAALAGAVGGRYQRRRDDRDQLRRRRELAARVRAAGLAGRNEVAMGADSVVDELQRAMALAEPHLSDGSRATRRDLTAAWKAGLAEDVRRHAAYLGDVLAAWQHAHNLHPDLATTVRLALQPGCGTVILSAEQAGTLTATLDRLDLRGDVTVSVVGAVADGPKPLELAIGSAIVTLPPDRGVARTLDYLPVALTVEALRLSALSLPIFEGVPLRVTLPTSAALVSIAAASQRPAGRGGLRLPARFVTAAAYPVLVFYSVAATRTASRPSSATGVRRYPFVGAVQTFVLLSALTSPRSAARRAVTLAGAAGLVGAGWRAAPQPRPVAVLGSYLVWPAAAWWAAEGLLADIDRRRRDLDERLADDDVRALADARHRGRAEVLVFVAGASAGLRQEVGRALQQMPADVRAEVVRRLDEVDARLAALR